MMKALWIALGAVGVAIALCGVVAAGFVATVYVDMKFGEPWNYATGFSFILLFVFVTAFVAAIESGHE